MARSLRKQYLEDLLLHSNIEIKNWRYNPFFEKKILERIIISLDLQDQNIIFYDFINQNYDTVIVTEQTGEYFILYYLPKANISDFEKYVLPLEDSKDPYKSYYYVDFTKLPAELVDLVQRNNYNTKKSKIISTRFIAGLVMDISGLEIHHAQYFDRYNSDGLLEKPKTSNDYNLLIPCTPDWHIRVFHSYYLESNNNDKEILLKESINCKKELEKWLNNHSNRNKLGAVTDTKKLENLLKLRFQKKAHITQLEKDFKLSRNIICDLCNKYAPLAYWLKLDEKNV